MEVGLYIRTGADLRLGLQGQFASGCSRLFRGIATGPRVRAAPKAATTIHLSAGRGFVDAGLGLAVLFDRIDQVDTGVHPRQRKAALVKGMPRSRWIKQLGKTDQIVEWLKNPAARPDLMPAEQFATPPDSLTVRYTIHEKGFLAKQITLVTTLLEAKRYSLSRLQDLFASDGKSKPTVGT